MRTVNGGASWTSSVSGLDAFAAYYLVSDPQNPALIHTSAWTGVQTSTDGGASWTLQAEDVSLSGIHMAAGAPSGLYGNQYSQIQRSLGGGATWEPRIVDTSPFGDFGPEIYGMQLHPNDPARLIIGNGRSTYGCCVPSPLVLESTDGGAHWTSLYEPPLSGTDQIYAYDLATPRG